METIFDYNISDEEKKNLFGYVFSKEEYNKDFDENEIEFIDNALVDLAYLFFYRGKKSVAEKYINRVSDVDLINSFWRTVYHPTVPTYSQIPD